jgi:predicted dehydrogenase
VLSEITAAVSIDECMRLVQACKRSNAAYMMAENCIYMKPNVVIAEMVSRGLFGQTYYAEGEYLHELKALNEITPWRRRWQSGVKGISYGTHSLGPILQWMPGDRVIAVCYAGSGHHYRDARGMPYENDDSSVMLCKMASGGLVKVRVDMLSERPYGLNYTLQGTEGAYESARSRDEVNRVWIRSQSVERERWLRLTDFEDEFLPEWWRKNSRAAEATGHDGSDFFVLLDFVSTITGNKQPGMCKLGIHEAMDMTLPGLVSQQWIAQNGVWLDVPDSREW